MSIVLARIDNRLIHGQVVQGWLPSMKVDTVIVVSEQASTSCLMRKMLRMSLPSDYKLETLTVPETHDYLAQAEAEKTFILMEDFTSLAALVDSGIKLNSVNVGNTKFAEGKKEYAQGVYLDEGDLELVKSLMAKQIKFDVRALPSSLSTRLF